MSSQSEPAKIFFPELVKRAISEAEQGGALLRNEVLSGFSGAKLIGLLQRLGKLFENQPDVCYAEIGVFQGLTLLSVANAAPKLPVFGIDNFSQFDPDHKNKPLVLERQRKLGLLNVTLLDNDYELALRNFHQLGHQKKIGVLFVDGPHDYRSQLLCVLLALPHLAENAVVVVDDCNYEHVRLSTRDLLLIDPTFKLVFEAYTSAHPLNLGRELEPKAREGWWNGVHVLVRGPEAAQMPVHLPECGNARERCEREHVLHSHALDFSGQELYEMAYRLAMKPDLAGVRDAIRLLRYLRRQIRERGLYRTANTYSAQISQKV